jgi:hypothetical protein
VALVYAAIRESMSGVRRRAAPREAVVAQREAPGMLE